MCGHYTFQDSKPIFLLILVDKFKLNNIEIYYLEVVIMAVKIDGNLCGHIENCPVQGLCIKLCEQGAIIEEDGDVKIVPENCDECDLCIQNCPNQAISKA